MSELLNGDVFGLNTPGSPKEGGDTQKNSNFLRAPRISYLIKPPATAARHHVQADPNPNKIELQLSSQLTHYSMSVPVFHHGSHVRNWFCRCDWHTGPPVHSYDATSTFTSRLTGRLIAPLMYHNLKHFCDPSETMYSISVDHLSPLPLEKCGSFVEDDIAAWPRTEIRASRALYCAFRVFVPGIQYSSCLRSSFPTSKRRSFINVSLIRAGDEHLSSTLVHNVAWFVVAINLTERNRYPSNSSSNSVQKLDRPSSPTEPLNAQLRLDKIFQRSLIRVAVAPPLRIFQSSADGNGHLNMEGLISGYQDRRDSYSAPFLRHISGIVWIKFLSPLISSANHGSRSVLLGFYPSHLEAFGVLDPCLHHTPVLRNIPDSGLQRCDMRVCQPRPPSDLPTVNTINSAQPTSPNSSDSGNIYEMANDEFLDHLGVHAGDSSTISNHSGDVTMA
ncbi:hypothetical protein B0H14DRAFT_2638162 [Mycena olivaceomarginata]|nr:hypothetical protein B0H14DRAFT_2638162 [Mycena olivaceomarginata]